MTTRWGDRLVGLVDEMGYGGWVKLAKNIGVAKSTFQHWVSADNEPRCHFETEVKIVNELGVGIHRLMNPNAAKLVTAKNILGENKMTTDGLHDFLGEEFHKRGFVILGEDEHSRFAEQLTFAKQLVMESGRVEHEIARLQAHILGLKDGKLDRADLHERIKRIQSHVTQLRAIALSEIAYTDEGEDT